MWISVFIIIIATYFAMTLYTSQSGKEYARDKYMKRQKNQAAANRREGRAQAAKTKRNPENAERKKKASLISQSGFELPFDSFVPTQYLQNAQEIWSGIVGIMSDFQITLPDFPSLSTITDYVGRHWSRMKSAELVQEATHILQMLISLGWLKQINYKIKGHSIFTTEPLRQRVTLINLLEAITKFGRLLFTKCLLVVQTQDLSALWTDELTSAYDDEYTFLTSQKVLIDLGRGPQVDAQTYDRRVEECIQITLSNLDTCKPTERSYYSLRLSNLRNIQSSRVLSAKEHIREKPYGFLLFGDSSVGKSAIVNALLRYVLRVNNKDYSPRAVVTLNSQDKFDSEFMTHHKGVILDDLCNTSESKQEGSPLESIIMFLNQVPMAALNPNADMKGKVMIQPDVVAGTTNVKDLQSNVYSNEPLSINRRFNVTITQRVKPEYQQPNTQMLDTDKVRHMANDQFPTYALFTVETPRYVVGQSSDASKSGRTRTIEFVPVAYKGKLLVDIEILDLLDFLKDDSQLHFAKQSAFVEGQKNLVNMPLCEVTQFPPSLCPHCKLDSQLGVADIETVKQWFLALEERVCSFVELKLTVLMSTSQGLAMLALLYRQSLKELFMRHVGHLGSALLMLFVCDILGAHHAFSVAVVVLLFFGAVCYYLLKREHTRLFKKYTTVKRPSQWYSELSAQTKAKILACFVAIGVWKIVRTIARRWKTIPTAQAAAPITSFVKNEKPYHQEKEFWDNSATEASYKIGDAGTSHQARTTRAEDADNMIGKRLLVLQKETGEFCNALPLKSNLVLLPYHMVGSSNEFVTLKKVGGHLVENLPLSSSGVQRIPGTDLCVWYCPGLPPQKDLTHFYPGDIYSGKKVTVHTVYNNDGTLEKYDTMTAQRKRIFTSRGGTFQGLEYYFPEKTFGGLCMATLIGHVDGVRFIAGHHLAGKDHVGAAGFVTQQQITTAIEALSNKPQVLVSLSANPMQTQSMGVEFGPLTKPHAKCVTNDLAPNAKVEIFGEHNQPRGSPSSAVVTSLISSAVTQVMGIEKQHGPPPDMGSSAHKKLDFSGKIDTATRFDPAIMTKAYTDYSTRLSHIPAAELAQVGKITNDVNLAGLDGVLGINAMNFRTSVGFPLKGPKTQYAKKSDRLVEGISCPRDVDPLIVGEMEQMETTLLAGKSIHAVFKAALKDEPTKITKNKVRVFAAANMPFVMLVRKYYLPLAALVQRNKEIFECAVGTVVQSPEWTDLFNHIGKYGWDRAIAGDYAKFDGRMSPDFMLMAFKLLIEIADRSGNYDADDLTIMRGIASEITYPTYDYFGTLLQFSGSNPSGHPLTVIVNSLVNSLYMRYVYFKIAADERWFRVPRFDAVVALMTYGDDNVMTVKKGYDAYNHTRIAQEFARVGITYTMADKDAESVPYVNLSDASFLKHFAVHDPELNLYRSVAEDSSIAKMLHTHLESAVLTKEQSSAEAIQNVALKYFENGRAVYEEKTAQLREVARLSGISGEVGPIMTYDERLQWYRSKYELDSQSGYKHTKNECLVNSEEEQLQLQCVAEMPLKNTAKEYSFPGGRTADLLFINGPAHLLVCVEVKVCDGGKKENFARTQALAFGTAFTALYPKFEIISLIYTKKGFSKVMHTNVGKANWEKLPKLPF